jgi:hypothetical protein
VNSTGARRAGTSIGPPLHKEPMRADDPVPVSAAHDRHSGIRLSPANFKIAGRYAKLGSGRNFAASFTSVAKQFASIFRMMRARWI